MQCLITVLPCLPCLPLLQIMAIATLSLCYNNHNVFTGAQRLGWVGLPWLEAAARSHARCLGPACWCSLLCNCKGALPLLT